MDENKKKVRFSSHQSSNLKITLPSTQKAKRHLSPLEDLVQCALCIDRLTDPKMLLCQHTFCLNCLQFHLSPGVKEVLCPTCQHPTPLEKSLESLVHLPGNLYINSILKLLSGNVSPKTPASKGPETRCIKCENYCQFSEHACQHCKQIFCGFCWEEHVKQIEEQLKNLSQHLSESYNGLLHQIESFKDRCSQLEESIKFASKTQIQAIKDKEKVCLEQSEQIKSNGLLSSENLKDQINELITNIKEEESAKTADNSQKINNFILLHRKTSSLLDEVSRWSDTRTVFDSKSFKIDSEVDATPDAEGDDDDLLQIDSLCVRNPLESHESLLAHYTNKIFTPKLTWNKCLRPAGISVAPWNANCIYVAGTDSRQVYGIDKQKGKLLFKISCPQMLCPVGITFSAENIFISDKWKHCVHVFDKSGTYLKTFGSKGDGPGQFTSPEGIAISSNNILFICDTGNDRIQALNSEDGRYLYAFGIIGNATQFLSSGITMDFKYAELNMPTGIAIYNDRLIVADSGNRRIKIYFLNGEKIQEFGTLGKNKGQFRSPEVVAIDPLGFIIVGDSGNARIQIFKPNGNLVRVFRNKGKFSWISGLHITPQLEMIVTDYKNHTVQVF